ncbi:hypothetical protein LTS08_004577 [Lithohypha guttulata]|nr:hypothetical protein LTS08_004577 [Lithohypha guttulata]
MKIIIIGSTGFIGSELLAVCRNKPSITSIVTITRRPLAQDILDDPKIVSLVLKDYRHLSEHGECLRDASAAIWALRASSTEVELDWPLGFAEAVIKLRESATTPFRYMHVSGIMAEKDQQKPLWFLQEGRRIKGLAEIKLRELANDNKGTSPWETYIARPSMVLPNPPGIVNSWAGWMLGSIRVDKLSKAMVDIVEKGAGTHTFENEDLVRRAADVSAKN